MSSPSPAITTAFVEEVHIPVDTAVRKINSQPDDKIRDGHIGRVKRVFAANPLLQAARQREHGRQCSFGYDVSWDKLPGESYALGIRLEVAGTRAVSVEPSADGIASETD